MNCRRRSPRFHANKCARRRRRRLVKTHASAASTTPPTAASMPSSSSAARPRTDGAKLVVAVCVEIKILRRARQAYRRPPPSTRRLLDGVVVPVPHRSTEPDGRVIAVTREELSGAPPHWLISTQVKVGHARCPGATLPMNTTPRSSRSILCGNQPVSQVILSVRETREPHHIAQTQRRVIVAPMAWDAKLDFHTGSIRPPRCGSTIDGRVGLGPVGGG